ncbi:MAG: TMEM14 family protein [Candidatus Omnitrophica bacterium]|nr:TMEM14 family protein [Candidatus Omnitrophota bacterium]
MDLMTLVVVVYGLFTLAGGIIGYVKAKSKASLIAGSIAGILLLGCAYGFMQGVRACYWISLIVALLLGIRFSKKWMVTRRVMPELLMMILSALTFIVVGLQTMTR